MDDEPAELGGDDEVGEKREDALIDAIRDAAGDRFRSFMAPHLRDAHERAVKLQLDVLEGAGPSWWVEIESEGSGNDRARNVLITTTDLGSGHGGPACFFSLVKRVPQGRTRGRTGDPDSAPEIGAAFAWSRPPRFGRDGDALVHPLKPYHRVTDVENLRRIEGIVESAVSQFERTGWNPSEREFLAGQLPHRNATAWYLPAIHGDARTARACGDVERARELLTLVFLQDQKACVTMELAEMVALHGSCDSAMAIAGLFSAYPDPGVASVGREEVEWISGMQDGKTTLPPPSTVDSSEFARLAAKLDTESGSRSRMAGKERQQAGERLLDLAHTASRDGDFTRAWDCLIGCIAVTDGTRSSSLALQGKLELAEVATAMGKYDLASWILAGYANHCGQGVSEYVAAVHDWMSDVIQGNIDVIGSLPSRRAGIPFGNWWTRPDASEPPNLAL